MKRFSVIFLMFLATPAFAQQAPSNSDYNAAMAEIAAQRDFMAQRAMNAAVQISQMQKQIEELKKGKTNENSGTPAQ